MSGLRQRYTRLGTTEPEQQVDSEARETAPTKAILLGVALLCIGTAFYALCYLHYHGHTKDHIHEGAELGLAILGTLTFLPGAYCSWVAFASWLGIAGYTYADIPTVE